MNENGNSAFELLLIAPAAFLLFAGGLHAGLGYLDRAECQDQLRRAAHRFALTAPPLMEDGDFQRALATESLEKIVDPLVSHLEERIHLEEVSFAIYRSSSEHSPELLAATSRGGTSHIPELRRTPQQGIAVVAEIRGSSRPFLQFDLQTKISERTEVLLRNQN